MDSHRFDRWTKLLAGRATRRSGISLAMAMVLGAMGNVAGTTARKRKRRNGYKPKKSKDKRHKTPEQPTDWSRTCSRGACFTRWPSDSKSDRDNRTYCEFICEQCDGDDPRQFCIVGGDVADCCDSGETCCDDRCVQFGTPDHCTGCDEPCRGAGRECCQSEHSAYLFLCADITSNRKNCGGCGQLCLHPDKRCCDGTCEDILFNDAHCGSCDPCPPGWECCHGRCIDKEKSWCCYDHPPSIGVCPAAAPCCTRSDGEPGCCLIF